MQLTRTVKQGLGTKSEIDQNTSLAGVVVEYEYIDFCKLFHLTYL